MTLRARNLSSKLAVLLAASFLSSPTLAADDADVAPRGAAVTVLKAAKSCFANIVEVSGTIIPREETQVRPERMGLKVAEVLADAGDSVTAGQVLARLNLPEGGQVTVQACELCHDRTTMLSKAITGIASSLWSPGVFHAKVAAQPGACVDCHTVSLPAATGVYRA